MLIVTSPMASSLAVREKSTSRNASGISQPYSESETPSV